LVALVSVVSTRIPDVGDQKIKKVKQFAMRLLKPATRIGLALMTAGATSVLDEAADAGAEAIRDETKDAIDAFWKKEAGRQTAMEEFRQAIQDLTLPDDVGEVRPLVIVIDELDRCRPDFALDVLEVIKHFFSVRHVHFILGVNLDALESSVRARYGGDIDATAYLQKFISFSVSLPEYVGDLEERKVITTYAQHLGSKVKVPERFIDGVVEQIDAISSRNHISMRDVQKVVSMAAFLPEEATSDKILTGWRVPTITLLIMKVVRPNLAGTFREARLEDSELLEVFGISSESVSETLEDGRRNAKYNRTSAIVYDCWRYICRDGVSDGSDHWTAVARYFGPFGNENNARKIPAKIEYDWLSKYRVS
jgi:hypothetical protein